IGHISHVNARPGVPLQRQYACGGAAVRATVPRANEIVCFRLDGSLQVLVVAPTMTNLNARGGGRGDYAKLPKGNLDITGQYFIWTSNMGGKRLDAFVVRVPSQLLTSAFAPIHGFVDFNGDGKSDILWRHSSGTVCIWLMDGVSLYSAGCPGGV